MLTKSLRKAETLIVKVNELCSLFKKKEKMKKVKTSGKD